MTTWPTRASPVTVGPHGCRLLPLFAVCDRWDVGRISVVMHPATDRLTVLVYDGNYALRVRCRQLLLYSVTQLRERKRPAFKAGNVHAPEMTTHPHSP
jgi:hypothetical protein